MATYLYDPRRRRGRRRRAIARVRRRRGNIRAYGRRHSSWINRLFKVVPWAVGGYVALDQMTKKNQENFANNPSWGPYELGYQLSDAIAHITGQHVMVLGKISGEPAYRNLAGIFNTYTFAGIGGYLLSKLPIPFKGKIAKISKGLMVGGAIGGFFDPPMTGGPTAPRQITSQAKVYSQASWR